MKVLLFILITIILGGCATRQDDSIHTIKFSEAFANVDEIMLSEYVSSLEYTPIETHPNALLGNIHDNCSIDDNFMYFPSGKEQATIHMFGRDGTYIKDIGRKGRGPGEFLAIAFITTIPESNILVVKGGPIILFYSLDDGKCLKQFNIEDLFERSNDMIFNTKGMTYTRSNTAMGNIVFHNNLFYITVADNTTFNQTLIILDNNLNIKSMIDIGETCYTIGFPVADAGYVYISNDKVNVVRGVIDTIYTIESNELIPQLVFDHTPYPTKKNDPIKEYRGYYKKHNIMRMRDMIEFTKVHISNKSVLVGSIYPPSSVSASLITKTHRFAYILYDKKTRKTKIIKPSEHLGQAAFTNDIDGGMPFWPSKQIGNKLYQFVDAVTFIEMSQKYNSPRMKEIAATLTDESNPVLIEATLK